MAVPNRLQLGVVGNEIVADIPHQERINREPLQEASRCVVSGGICGSLHACRQWGCRAGDEALTRGLAGVAAALDLCGLGKRNDSVRHGSEG
jgi:hypothetical protein